MAQAIVTGGSGYVGGHLIRHLVDQGQYETIVNIDYQPPAVQPRDGQRLHYINADIRQPIDPEPLRKLGCGSQTDIFNLAAICKIPGHPTVDYFRTNIRGAETVCKLAANLQASTIVFTSSIAPYGASERKKTEASIPQPDNAYGCSKLVAEYIHRGWRENEADRRKLVVLRPGIIFGRNEQANFVRLYKSLKKGFFVYPGRKDTRKACVYVKDVARACTHFASGAQKFQLYNVVYPSAPTIEEICLSIAENTDARPARFAVPGPLVKGAARLIYAAGKFSGREFNGIHPDRVDKVMISTNVSGEKLAQTSFDLQYSLKEGIREWFAECDGALY